MGLHEIASTELVPTDHSLDVLYKKEQGHMRSDYPHTLEDCLDLERAKHQLPGHIETSGFHVIASECVVLAMASTWQACGTYDGVRSVSNQVHWAAHCAWSTVMARYHRVPAWGTH